MAVESPMQNFNRNNPLVIKAKYRYDDLQVERERFTKSIVLFTSIILSFVLIIGVVLVLYHIPVRTTIAVLLTCAIIYISMIYELFYKTISDPINSKIDKMVSLEMSEVMNINVEYVQDVIDELNHTIGKTTGAHISFRFLSTSIIVVEILLLVISPILK